MIGHEISFSETNARGWVAICECKWISSVHKAPRGLSHNKHRLAQQIEAMQGEAVKEHAVHLEEVRADIAAQSDRALASSAAYIRAVAPTVRHVGRFGRG